MAKKRGKRTKKTVKAKKVISKKSKSPKSSLQEKARPKAKDEEFGRQLKELETGQYYGYREKTEKLDVEKEVKPIEKKEVSKPVVKKEISKPKPSIFPKRANDGTIPAWFYMSSIFAAFLFLVYISIFATLHFESIEHMNITIVFLFIAMVSYFLISAMYMVSENKKQHAIPPVIFFVGIVSIMIYAFKAIDTSDLVRFSIIYTIIVAAISAYVLAIRR